MRRHHDVLRLQQSPHHVQHCSRAGVTSGAATQGVRSGQSAQCSGFCVPARAGCRPVRLLPLRVHRARPQRRSRLLVCSLCERQSAGQSATQVPVSASKAHATPCPQIITCRFADGACHSLLPLTLNCERGVPRHQEVTPWGGNQGGHQSHQVVIHVPYRQQPGSGDSRS